MAERTRLLTPPRVALGALLALTLVVRLGVLLAMRDNLRQDPDAYRNIARCLLTQGVFGFSSGPREISPAPTAYRPPLYPFVLAKFASFRFEVIDWRVGVVHMFVGLASVWLMWIVAGQMEGSGLRVQGSGEDEGERGREGEREWGREGKNVAFRFAAGLLVACDPILLHQSTLIMTETLAAFLTVLCLFCLNRFSIQRGPWTAGLAGGAIGLAILCRPTYLPWLGLTTLACLGLQSRYLASQKRGLATWQVRAGDWLWRGTNAAAMLLTAAAILAPWTIRNYQRFGRPIVTTTHGGYTFYLANNPLFYRYLREGDRSRPWPADELDVEITGGAWGSSGNTSINHNQFDEFCYERAWSTIKANKWDFINACLYRVRQLWSPLPHQLTAKETLGRRLLRYAVCVWYVGVYALAAVGIWRLRGKLLAPPWLWGVLLCLVFTAVHTFYWTNLRMRAPLMPVVALVAAQGLATLWAWWRGRKHRVG